MENSERAPNPALSGRNATEPEQAAHIEGSRVVAADFGMPGTKGMAKPFVPLLWLLVPFFFCLGYGILTR